MPCANRKKIDSNVLKDGDYFLIRYLEANELAKLVNPNSGLIKVKNLHPSDHSLDLSTFLAGYYTEGHIQLELTGDKSTYYGLYCEPDCTPDAPVYEIDFIVNGDRGCWNLKIEDVIGTEIEILERNRKGDVINSWKAICKVEHTPTHSNFWHFSVRWRITGFDVDSDKIDLKTGDPLPSHSAFKSLKNLTRAHLAKFCNVAFPDGPKLVPEVEFKKAI